ncbi:hypothetical protein [Variovorax guangxiensis]|uniref:hypothetical protein n=1 Tax=Variovorax guangxiensis TaxID=1775474 RepID=UPI002858F32F|nr:hypothetical protein [Variovorax guangxiensis]MDR6860540.1 hypothetical protein [Variovorax guangxiensis]
MALLYLIGAIACCCGGWWLWPTGITELTFAAITLGMLLKAFGSAFLWMTGVTWAIGWLSHFDS